MEKKINLVEILQQCPSGTKLYSPIFGDVYLDKIRSHLAIVVTTDKEQGKFKEEFLYDGRYGMNGECMLFPSKDQRDWSKFQKPFKDGDIVTSKLGTVIIYKEITTYGYCGSFASLDHYNQFIHHYQTYFTDTIRFATEEEKRKLFNAIRENGYKWNNETKTLEKLVTPKFKVGDRVVRKDRVGVSVLITRVVGEFYYSNVEDSVKFFSIEDQDNWVLIPDKFDISTLIPYESKVLIRNTLCGYWEPAFWGAYIIDHSDGLLQHHDYLTTKGFTHYCIPYEGNEHLIGKTDDCNEYYKIWE